MKNIDQIHKIENVNNLFNIRKSQVKILSFEPDMHHHYILKLKISKLKKDNYRIVLMNNLLTIMIFESIEFNKPVHLHNYKLHDLEEESSYSDFKSIDFTLPEDDFYLINHGVNYSGILKITFGKIYHN